MEQVSQQTVGDERLVLLAMALDTRTGLTFDEMASKGLLGDTESVQEDSLRHSFALYRRQFSEMGIKVEEFEVLGETRYRIDARLTFADPSEVSLSPDEALQLLAMLSVYLDGSQRPYVEEVRRARDKIASLTGLAAAVRPHAATGSPAAGRGSSACTQKPASVAKTYRLLEQSLEARCPVVFSYRARSGQATRRTVRPYGFFERGDATYLVAHDESAEKAGSPDPMRVFRLDRIEDGSVRQVAGRTFDIPASFSPADYMHLPFQYGSDAPFVAVFRASAELAPSLRPFTQGEGTWTVDETDPERAALWHVEANDLAACAEWAVGAAARGLVAVSPLELRARVASLLSASEATHA